MSTATATPSGAASSFSLSKSLGANVQIFALIGALAAIWIIGALATRNAAFISPNNISNLFRQMTITALMSVGMVLVIVTGNIDLSVGKLAGFVSVVVAVIQARLWTRSVPLTGTELQGGVAIFVTIIVLIGLFTIVIPWRRNQVYNNANAMPKGAFYGLMALAIPGAMVFANFIVAPLVSPLFAGALEAITNTRSEAITTATSVLVAVTLGTLVGVVQGYIIAYLRVPAFIVTLGGLWVFNGLIVIVTEGKTIPANQPLFSVIGQQYVPAEIGWLLAVLVVGVLVATTLSGRARKARYGLEMPPLWFDLLKVGVLAVLVAGFVLHVNNSRGIPNPVLLLAVVAVVVGYMSTNTRFGRYAYAIGGNREAARLSGVNIRRNIFLIFVLMGFLCGIAGTALASYVGYGTTAAGDGYELDAIAACILGGTSTLGGEGTVIGAMLGALVMASLSNLLQMLNVAPGYVYMLKGGVLVAAVLFDVYLRRNRQ